MTDRKKLGVAFWATVMMGAALFAYPISFGPACWLNGRTHVGDRLFLDGYRPLVRLYSYSPKITQSVARKYVELWLGPRMEFVGDPDGSWFVYTPLYAL